MNRTRKKPGRRPQFSEKQVINAVLLEGINTFTLRSVATRLGVRAPSLYRVFGSREEMQRAAVAQLAAEFVQFPAGDTWQDCLYAFSSRIWAMCETYPGLAETLITLPEAQAGGMAQVSVLVERLLDRGIPGGTSTALFALDFIGDLTLGTFFSMQSYGATDGEGLSGLERFTAALHSSSESSEIHASSVSIDATALVDEQMRAMGDRGLLPAKLDFIIAGIAAGHGPQSASQP